jgi:hypothetical protein
MDSSAYLRDVVRTFKNYQALGDAALAQVPADADFHKQIDPDSNSLAVIVKHVSGNLRSRFTDFLTADGEKPDRNRDGEFEMPEAPTGAEIRQWWQKGFAIALASIEALGPDDLDRTVHIRGEAFLVPEALSRSMTHTAYHVGQIAYVARHLAAPNWKSLSIPKGKSSDHAKGDFKQGILARTERTAR